MIKAFRRFFKPSNRSLIRELVVSDFKLRYQNSVLGYLWSLLRPMFLFGILYVVFTQVFKVGKDIPFFASYLLLGIVLWTFFIEATVSGMNSITGRGDLIRKVSIPKYTIVMSTTLSAFVNFGFNMVVVIIAMIINGVPFRATLIVAPFLIAELFVFSMAVGFLLAALYVKFRDFTHIWDVSLQILFYATPILYPFTLPPQKIQTLLSLSPLAQIFQDLREVMITPVTRTTAEVFSSQMGRLIPMGIVLLTIALATWYFKRSSKNFAEEL